MARQQKKLSRKELREDPLMKAIGQAQIWMEEHGVKLAIAAGVAVVAVAVFFLVGQMKQSANEEAVAEVVQAQQAYQQQGEAGREQFLDRLSEIADEYEGTFGGQQAQYTVAQVALEEGDYARAEELFAEFARTYGGEYMVPLAATLGEAAALEGLEDWSSAAKAYDKAANHRNGDHVRPYALVNAGRCWMEAGDTARARQRLETALDEYPQSSSAEDARRELAKLELAG